MDPSFQGIIRIFILSFENTAHRARSKGYKVELKDYNVMIDGQNCFYQLVKNDPRTYNYVKKITIVQGDDYRTGCFLDYLYLKENYKSITIDLSKQQALKQVTKSH